MKASFLRFKNYGENIDKREVERKAFFIRLGIGAVTLEGLESTSCNNYFEFNDYSIMASRQGLMRTSQIQEEDRGVQ
jgi:hypothetical protein